MNRLVVATLPLLAFAAIALLPAASATSAPAAADALSNECVVQVGTQTGVACYDASKSMLCMVMTNGQGTLCLIHVHFDEVYCVIDHPTKPGPCL